MRIEFIRLLVGPKRYGAQCPVVGGVFIRYNLLTYELKTIRQEDRKFPDRLTICPWFSEDAQRMACFLFPKS